jgi:hypothetical protein
MDSDGAAGPKFIFNASKISSDMQNTLEDEG